MLASGSNIYVGGSFTTVGGSTHKNIAEVNATSGAVITAFANTTRGPNKVVRAMVIANGNLYVGGAFTTRAPYLAEVNATTNTYIPTWQPVVDAEVRALATDTGQTRIVEGGFQQCAIGSGCDGRIGIGAVNTTDGSFVPFAYHGPPTFIPPPGFPYRPFQVIGFAQDGNTLFAAGTGNGGTALSLNMEDGTLNWQAGFNGNVVGIGVTDSVVYVGRPLQHLLRPDAREQLRLRRSPGLGDPRQADGVRRGHRRAAAVEPVGQHRPRHRGGRRGQQPRRGRRRVHPRRRRERPALRPVHRVAEPAAPTGLPAAPGHQLHGRAPAGSRRKRRNPRDVLWQ